MASTQSDESTGEGEAEDRRKKAGMIDKRQRFSNRCLHNPWSVGHKRSNGMMRIRFESDRWDRRSGAVGAFVPDGLWVMKAAV